MATGTILTNQGKNVALNRTFKGTPDYLQPACFKVGTGTTTPALTDTDLANAITIGGASTKDIAAGYPIFNETTHQATIRCLLLTTECNGNSLTEFGLFNKDGSAKLFSRIVHTAITKTASVQVVYVEKDIIS